MSAMRQLARLPWLLVRYLLARWRLHRAILDNAKAHGLIRQPGESDESLALRTTAAHARLRQEVASRLAAMPAGEERRLLQSVLDREART